jgi:hypothetical protein
MCLICINIESHQFIRAAGLQLLFLAVKSATVKNMNGGPWRKPRENLDFQNK